MRRPVESQLVGRGKSGGVGVSLSASSFGEVDEVEDVAFLGLMRFVL